MSPSTTDGPQKKQVESGRVGKKSVKKLQIKTGKREMPHLTYLLSHCDLILQAILSGSPPIAFYQGWGRGLISDFNLISEWRTVSGARTIVDFHPT